MKLITVLILGLGLFSGKSHAEVFSSCSVCIVGEEEEVGEDWVPDQGQKECTRWLKKVARAPYSRIFKRSEIKNVLTNDAIRCEELNVYSAFHGYSKMVNLPFEFSHDLAMAYQPKQVRYTGSTCSIFQKVDQLKDLGQKLAASLPGIRFEISGNQNVGFTLMVPVLARPKEMQRFSSKATVVIDQGEVSLGFEPCSRAGRSCFVEDDEPTSKYCSDERGITKKQTCYPMRRSLLQGRSLGLNGVWADPI